MYNGGKLDKCLVMSGKWQVTGDAKRLPLKSAKSTKKRSLCALCDLLRPCPPALCSALPQNGVPPEKTNGQKKDSNCPPRVLGRSWVRCGFALGSFWVEKPAKTGRIREVVDSEGFSLMEGRRETLLIAY